MKSKFQTALAAAIAVLALGSGVGSASAAVINGKISKLDPAGHRLTVAGHVYRFGPNFPAATLKQGQLVRLQYGWSRGHRTANRILPATVKTSAARSLHPAKPKQTTS